MNRVENSALELAAYIGALQQRGQNVEWNHNMSRDLEPGRSEMQVESLESDLRLVPFAMVMGTAMCETVIITSEVPADKLGHPFIAGIAASLVGLAFVRSMREYMRATQTVIEHNKDTLALP